MSQSNHFSHVVVKGMKVYNSEQSKEQSIKNLLRVDRKEKTYLYLFVEKHSVLERQMSISVEVGNLWIQVP